MKRAVSRLLAMAVLACLAKTGVAGKVGFEEDFALAPDRSLPLRQLIPGTPEYFYYSILNYQNTGEFAKGQELIDAWRGRVDINGDPRLMEMENRQALLTYDKNKQQSLDFLTRRLGLAFNAERETADQQRALPTVLDANLISRATLTALALQNHPERLDGFENSALDFIDTATLSPNRLNEFLSRLERPDFPRLPDLIERHMREYYGTAVTNFTLPIDQKLMLTQLDEMVRLHPSLLNDTNFVNAYLTRLRPANGVDWQHDPVEEAKYFDRLWSFVSKLGPAHNSLKAHVLFQRLTFDRTQGVWDKDRFLTYLQLPRNVSYINPNYMSAPERYNNAVNLNADYSAATLFRPINNDEPLVRSYLLHFFAEAADPEAYRLYIENTYLQQAFAEAKIVNGIGDQEKWATQLPPSTYQALKDRIDLDFAYTNKQYYMPEDKVAIDINVKNVKTLLVKVYDINTPSFYKNNGRELGTDVLLDGLVANEESVVTYDEPALRRVARHFEFPKLSGRGAYIIEFIGNGISSRALVIKGKLHYLEQTGAAGHEFTVLDETNKKVVGASIYMAGHEYKADPKDGTINVPFSNAPGSQPILLQLGNFASYDHFNIESETYSFRAAFHVDREELLKGGTATVVIRPMLYVNNEPASLRLLDEPSLEKPTLVITSVDREGTPTTKEVPNFDLYLDRERTYDFPVPENLASISFVLRAHVKNLSQNKTIDLADGRTFTINGIDASDKIEDVYLTHTGGQYLLDVLGKTGEVIADHPVHLVLKHKDFRDPVNVTLKSDSKGRITLGTLEGIANFTVSTNEGVTHTWAPVKDQHTPVASAHAAVGKPIQLPYMGAKATATAEEFSLLELRDGAFYADRLSAIKIKDGLLTIDDLPAGDYSLRYKETGEVVSIRIAPGEERDGWVLSKSRFLQQRDTQPLQIASVTSDADNITVMLVNTSKLTRVHVVASRYVPDFAAYASFSTLSAPGDAGMTLPTLDAQYVAGRNIGDEYRYILDRKYAKLFPGNTLARPGLLLQPWSISKTETGKQSALAGELPYGLAAEGSSGLFDLSSQHSLLLAPAAGFSTLDFLPSMSAVLTNLVPDEKGMVVIPRKSLGDRQDLQVVAVDLGVTVAREVALPEVAMTPRDLRLKNALDVAKHFTEQKQVIVLAKGAAYSASDASSAAIEAYDSVARVYKLYATLSNNPTLAEFSFILDWPKLTQAQKQEKYSKYACHELNFFLSRKDPAFFAAVVKPYLANKKDKTFMDHYLLGDDLAVFVKPTEYERLNIAERTLLAERVVGEQAATARHIKDRYDLLPGDVDRFNFLFRTALQGGALDQNGVLKLGEGAVALNGGNTFSGDLSVSGTVGGLASGAFGGGGPGGGGGAGRGGRGGASGPAPAASVAAPRAADRNLAGDKEDKDQLRKAAEAESQDMKLADGLANFQRQRSSSALLDSAAKRADVAALYLRLDKTEEWAENNYYHVLIEQQNASLVPVNAFWKDYAAAANKAGFLSANLAEPGGNFSEMMLALSVLDLPFESPKLDVAHKDGKLSFTAPGPMVVFHRETNEASTDPAKTPILVSENFFRASDRYTYVENERADKYVAEEFLTHVVYGCQVVVTNPTSSRQKLDVLLQIPQGALPVNNGLYTRGLHEELNPYESKAIEYYFYFPSAGSFAHYPVHVAKNEKVIAFAPTAMLKVVETPSKVDTASWDYVSQNGTPEQVLQYLRDNNVDRLNLDRIAWRMKDADYFAAVTNLLASRHVYNNTLWSYGIKNNNVPAIREYLQHADGFVAQSGAYIDSTLLTIDPVERRTYQFLEYTPLVNARIHKMGRDRQIVNDRFYQQYERLMTVERYRPKMNADDLMAVTYYLLLQDRIDEAQTYFTKVDASSLATKLQYDYFHAYLDFYTDTHQVARSIADKYKDYPVDRWRQLFTAVSTQLDELDGKTKGGTIVNQEDRTQQQTALAASAANLEFKVEDRKVTMDYQNIAEARVNYYLMDIELMFSQNPFLGRFAGQFSSILPNESAAVKLDTAKKSVTFDLPDRFKNSNVMVEISAGGVTRTQAYYPNSLALQMVENYGQVHVTSQKSGESLPKVYVKVYARMRDGHTEFYKDGYTDLRGRFEYASLSTNDLDNVDRFAILVLSDTEGAVVREAAPPKQ